MSLNLIGKHLQKCSHGSKLLRKHLDPQHGYRCISPSTSHQVGLNSFYGEDRSFCRGLIFDETDFIVEFVDIQPQPQEFEPIIHHKSAYRGRLQRDNVAIRAIYFKKVPMDYSHTEFMTHLRQIYREVPQGTLFYQYVDLSYDVQSIVIKAQWRKT